MMRIALWLLALFAIAVAFTLTARLDQGYVIVVYPPWRLELSFMLALLLRAGVIWLGSTSVTFEQVITTGWAKAPFFTIFPIFCATTLIHALGHLARALGKLRRVIA